MGPHLIASGAYYPDFTITWPPRLKKRLSYR